MSKKWQASSPSWRRRQARRSGRYYRPRVETLEDRLAPAILTVNTLTDGDVADPFLTLHEAIKVANGTLAFALLTPGEKAQVSGPIGLPGLDEIRFSVTGTISLGQLL